MPTRQSAPKTTRPTSAQSRPGSSAATQPAVLVKQGAKFGLVGVSNTIIDYAVLIGLTTLFQVPLANTFMVKYVSGSVAMVNSFYWNRRWVFRSRAGLARSGLRFLISTLVSIWAIQPGVVFLLSGTAAGLAFGTFWFNLADSLGIVALLPHTLTPDFVIKTVAFGCGVIGSAIWNFTLYKFWAFREK